MLAGCWSQGPIAGTKFGFAAAAGSIPELSIRALAAARAGGFARPGLRW